MADWADLARVYRQRQQYIRDNISEAYDGRYGPIDELYCKLYEYCLLERWAWENFK